jgi:8-oxo-dGTP pyrophosphatase MutT (NUDIX family)
MYEINPKDKIISRQIFNSFKKEKKEEFVNNIIISVDKILLLKRCIRSSHPSCWCTAGGHREEGETLLQTCARETYEETGLKPKVDYVLLGNPYRLELPDCILYYFVSNLINDKATIVLDEDEHDNYVMADKLQFNGMNLILDLKNHLNQII